MHLPARPTADGYSIRLRAHPPTAPSRARRGRCRPALRENPSTPAASPDRRTTESGSTARCAGRSRHRVERADRVLARPDRAAGEPPPAPPPPPPVGRLRRRCGTGARRELSSQTRGSAWRTASTAARSPAPPPGRPRRASARRCCSAPRSPPRDALLERRQLLESASRRTPRGSPASSGLASVAPGGTWPVGDFDVAQAEPAVLPARDERQPPDPIHHRHRIRKAVQRVPPRDRVLVEQRIHLRPVGLEPLRRGRERLSRTPAGRRSEAAPCPGRRAAEDPCSCSGLRAHRRESGPIRSAA